MKKAIVLASSRGIGKGIADSLERLNMKVVRTSTEKLDTSDISSVEKFVETEKWTDVLVLNTGGPPAQKFEDITREDCEKYHNQLFYGFFKILQEIHLNDNGFVFLISSYNLKEPSPKLLLSNAYRIAFTSILKCLSKEFAKRNITTINIAPGPINTDRLKRLVSDMESLEKRIPLGRVGNVEEIGNFVSSIIEKNIKYLTGVTINFDGGKSNYVV
jgi:3-oxoacyl-[acyl-carrier protein] reductase